MINFLAVVLATILLPTSPANTVLPETYSSNVGPTLTTIQTPNGTNVDFYYMEEGDLSKIDNADAYYADYFTYADTNSYISCMARGTYTYNSFAYAFYLYWGGNIACHILDINPYLEDKSFVVVSTPQPEDIILYYSGDNPKHAGIIKSVLNKPLSEYFGSNLIVESKWFPCGVFQHRGDLCPCMPKYSITESEAADRVVYLRRHETHNLIAVQGSDKGTTHTVTCNECGYTAEVNHEYTYSSIDKTQHTATCACGKTVVESHTWIPYKSGITLSLTENIVAPNALGTFVQCKYCNLTRRLEPGEFVPVIKDNIGHEDNLYSFMRKIR